MAAQETKRNQRSCIGCGRQAGKASLWRIVRSPDGEVAFDPTGRAPGRGAYVCSLECLARARKSRKIERALRVKLGDGDYAHIEAELERARHACVGMIEE